MRPLTLPKGYICNTTERHQTCNRTSSKTTGLLQRMVRDGRCAAVKDPNLQTHKVLEARYMIQEMVSVLEKQNMGGRDECSDSSLNTSDEQFSNTLSPALGQ